MSDVPVAAPAAAPTAAPAEGGAPAAPAAAPKPIDPRLELESALKKAGGLKFKAGGKEVTVDSIEKLTRYAQRGLPVEESLEQVAKQRAEIEPVRALLEQLQSGDEDAAEAALEKLLDSGKLDKVAERRLRRQFEREKEMEQLSPREKELRAALEQERGEKKKLADAQKAAEEQRAKAMEEQQTARVRQHIEGNVIETLKSLDLPPKLAPIAVEFMKPIIRASLNAGVGLDPAVLAEKVRPMFDQLFEYKTRNLEGEKLLSLFGGDVGRKYRQALLAQLNGSKPAAVEPPKPEGERSSTSTKPAWDPRRMF